MKYLRVIVGPPSYAEQAASELYSQGWEVLDTHVCMDPTLKVVIIMDFPRQRCYSRLPPDYVYTYYESEAPQAASPQGPPTGGGDQ